YRLRLAGLAGLFSALVVFHADFFQSLEPLAAPSKTALFVAVRVVHPGDLQRRREKILVNEGVVVGKKDAETGVRMVPADNPLVGFAFFFFFVDFSPGFLSDLSLVARFRRFHPRYSRGDLHPATVFFADQYAAYFGLAVRTRVLPYLAQHLAFDRHPR